MAAVWLALLAGFLPSAGAATDGGGLDAKLPVRICQDGRIGFVGTQGQVLCAPRYALCGDWSEGRLWVQASAGAQGAGRFIDERAQPVTAAVYRDLSGVLPEIPLPRFERGIAIVGLEDGGYGYLDRRGRLLGRTSAAGAFQRQDDDLLLFVDGGKAGFMDRKGEIRIPARHVAATPFRGGRAAARAGERWGLIDPRGTWVAQPVYDELLWFADEPRCWMYRQAQRWGAIDRNGTPLTAALYDDFGVWHGAAVSVRVGDLWGLLAADGKLRVPPTYRALTPFGDDGALWAALADGERWGVIDSDGRVLAACRFDAVQAPARDLWLAQQEGLWGILNRTNGAWLAAARYQRILPLDAPFEGLALVEEGRHWGAIETATGRERLPPRFAQLLPWHKWLAAQEGESVHLLDGRGGVVRSWKGVADGLPRPEGMTEGAGVLRTAAGISLITATGDLLGTELFEEAGAWSDGLLPVRRDGAWGFVDRQGGWVIAPRFEAAGSFADGLAPVCEEGRWGLCDRRGNYLVKPAFEALGRPWRGLVPARRGGHWGLIDRRGKEVLPLVYDSIEWGEGAVTGDR
jgi:hypothetical protein